MGLIDETGRERTGFRLGLAVVIGLLVAIGVGGWLAARAISDAVCGSYNSFSNDFCDEWHYDTPPAEAVPVPSRWGIRWADLDCGSGGCGYRLYVLSPEAGSQGGVAAYLRGIQALGWRIDAVGAEARMGDLHLSVEPASEHGGGLLVPMSLAHEEFVFVALAICDEGTVCD